MRRRHALTITLQGGGCHSPTALRDAEGEAVVDAEGEAEPVCDIEGVPVMEDVGVFGAPMDLVGLGEVSEGHAASSTCMVTPLSLQPPRFVAHVAAVGPNVTDTTVLPTVTE